MSWWWIEKNWKKMIENRAHPWDPKCFFDFCFKRKKCYVKAVACFSVKSSSIRFDSSLTCTTENSHVVNWSFNYDAGKKTSKENGKCLENWCQKRLKYFIFEGASWLGDNFSFVYLMANNGVSFVCNMDR